MLPATPLVLNLRIPAYCETVYGGLDVDQIAARFSAVDSAGPTELLASWQREKFAFGIPRKLESEKCLPRKLARFIAVVAQELR